MTTIQTIDTQDQPSGNGTQRHDGDRSNGNGSVTRDTNRNLQHAFSVMGDMFRRDRLRTKPLEGLRVAILAADGFEQVELTVPMRRLGHEGADVKVVSPHAGRIRGLNFMLPGRTVKVDETVQRARSTDFDALFIPGGFINPDLLRQSRRVLDFVSDFAAQGKPIASICHGPWVLISAGLVRGRRLTSWPGIADDIVNAGGTWTDEPVVFDGQLVTSRGPIDLPRFDDALVEHYAVALGRSPELRHAIRARPSDRLLENTVAAAAAISSVRMLRGVQSLPPPAPHA
jgi:protease I